jgi:hypothetical protein
MSVDSTPVLLSIDFLNKEKVMTKEKRLKTLEEFLAESESYRNSFLGRMNIFYCSIKRGARLIINSPRRLKWSYQRMVRGYSDRDAWNGDNFLAGQIAGILELLVNQSYSVPMSYGFGLDEYTPDTKIMVERRDADYKNIIMIYKEYHNNGIAYDEEWQKEFGGVLDKDMKDALQWLVEHFEELWS